MPKTRSPRWGVAWIAILASALLSSTGDADTESVARTGSGVLPQSTPVTTTARLFGFETEDQMRAWRVLGPGSVERTTERAASGRYSAKVTLRVWTEGDQSGPNEPALGDLSKWSFAHLVYDPPADWSFWRRWRAKVFIEGEGSLYHEVVDANGRKWWRPLSLEGSRGQWGTIEFPFTAGVDLKQVAQQWFYRSANQPQVTFYVDDVELAEPDAQWIVVRFLNNVLSRGFGCHEV